MSSKIIRALRNIFRVSSGVLAGRVSAGVGPCEELTPAQARTLLDVPTNAQMTSAVAGKIGGSVGSTDNRLVRSDGTGTLTVQSTGITVDDSNNVSGVNLCTAAQLTASGGNVYFAETRISRRLSGVLMIQGDSNVCTVLLGGLTASFPAIKRNGTAITFRLADDSADAPVTCGAITSSDLMCAGTYTVATLPSASANAGKFAQVTDSSVTTFRSTVAGGGSTRVPVFSDGTNWVVA